MKVKIKVQIEKEVTIKTLQVEAWIGFWEDAKVNGVRDWNGTIPCRDDEHWMPLIDIDTGKILNWTQGVKASTNYKIRDEGVYHLQDEQGNTVLTKTGYVPKIMTPKEEGFGDYITMDIDENGFIQKWIPNIDDFLEENDY